MARWRSCWRKAPGRGEVEEFSVVLRCRLRRGVRELEARRGGSLGKNGERRTVGIYRRSRMASGRKEEGDREGEDSFLHGWKVSVSRGTEEEEEDLLGQIWKVLNGPPRVFLIKVISFLFSKLGN